MVFSKTHTFSVLFKYTPSSLVNREKEKMYLFSIGYTVLVVLNKPHYRVRKAFPARFAEMDMNVKGGIPYPLHKVGLRVQRGGGAAGLAGVMVHRLSFPFISPFNRSAHSLICRMVCGLKDNIKSCPGYGIPRFCWGVKFGITMKIKLITSKYCFLIDYLYICFFQKCAYSVK